MSAARTAQTPVLGSTRAGRPPRRTQQERSAETREKVVRAATECVAELGLGGATMNAISSRAGVSWGAMQHQFGDKDSILDAVLDRGLAQLEESLLEVAKRQPDPRERVHAFIQLFGELLEGPVHRSVVEIQSGRSRERGDESSARMAEVGQAMGRIWSGLFGDVHVSAERQQAAQHFTWAVLSGITAARMLFPGPDHAESQLRILEDTLLRLFDLDT